MAAVASTICSCSISFLASQSFSSSKKSIRNTLVGCSNSKLSCCGRSASFAGVPVGGSSSFRRDGNFEFLVKASASESEEVKTENEELVDETLDTPEGTAAATVAFRTEGVTAVEKVVELAKQSSQVENEDAVSTEEKSFIGPELAAIYANCKRWNWRGHSINYVSQGSGPAVLLVHGFGASIGHWRKNIGVLAKTNTVYAIDLLGFGASDKPLGFKYTMETWAELLVDFLKEIVVSPVVLVGNSIGSLACLIASAEAPAGTVRGTVLINCAGGMNNKAVTEDWRLKLLLPILLLIEFILSIPALATRIFNNIKSRENLRNVLQSVYKNKEAVDDELIEVIRKPAEDAGALNAFITINAGPPGPKPQTLLPKISHPVLILWGDDDPFTPLDGPVGKWITAYAASTPNVQLNVLPNVGHCPQDDRPELVHEKLVPWLTSVFA
ncbi:hypothetical protein R1flu_024292 [Riccia fluitans]|uniref:AB hydrolase-1 domain-containing protein n=1 Tax=Riccia fluitans TaxID=41844 RepID=A0ABD1XUH7_9MARC